MGPVLRFLCCYACLTALLYGWGERYSALWCEPLKYVAAALPSAVVVSNVTIQSQAGERVFRTDVATRDAVPMKHAVVPAGVRMHATTLQAYAHHHLVLIVATLFAWPVPNRSQRIALLAVAVPAVAVATLLDLPFALLGVLQEVTLATFDPAARDSDPAVLYYQFLQRGGRPVLSLAIAAVAAGAVLRARRRSSYT